MKKLNLKKLTVTAILAAVAVVGSLFSFPVFGSKCAPVQHLVNVLCAVTVGPWWALAQAFIASLIRNLLGLGSPLAFPGSMCGALLGGLLYKYGKKLPFAYLGEVAGTGIIGGMLSYPVAYLVMGNKAAALFTFVVPFLISTCGGTLIAIIITLPLKKSGLLGRMKESLEGYNVEGSAIVAEPSTFYSYFICYKSTGMLIWIMLYLACLDNRNDDRTMPK